MGRAIAFGLHLNCFSTCVIFPSSLPWRDKSKTKPPTKHMHSLGCGGSYLLWSCITQREPKSVSGLKYKSASMPCAFGPSWLSNGHAILLIRSTKLACNEMKGGCSLCSSPNSVSWHLGWIWFLGVCSSLSQTWLIFEASDKVRSLGSSPDMGAMQVWGYGEQELIRAASW